MKVFIGIDVGKQGGIVLMSENGTIETFKTPLVANEIDLNEIKSMIESFSDVIVGIENVANIFGSSSKSNFQFGRALGLVEGLVTGIGLPFVKVHAKVWQKLAFEGIPVVHKQGKVKINKKTGVAEETKKVDTKAMALLAAKRLYPKVNLLATERSKIPHDGIVDSLLIAHYLKITNK
jgi:hypothetical protein